MKPIITLFAALTLAACSGDSESQVPLDSVEMPSQDEADEAANKAIDESNADAEFEALEREINADL